MSKRKVCLYVPFQVMSPVFCLLSPVFIKGRTGCSPGKRRRKEKKRGKKNNVIP